MKRLFTLFLLQFTWMFAFSASQYTDRILLNNTKCLLYTNPLETFFTKEPSKRPVGSIQSSELWRGYIASFNVKDKRLYVDDILVQNPNKGSDGQQKTVWNSVADSVFKSEHERFCDWYTGYLIIPTGKLIKKASTSYASMYDSFILLFVSKGMLTSEKKLTANEYAAFIDTQFKCYSKTKEYKQARKALPRLIKSGKEKDAFLKLFIDEYASKAYGDSRQ